MPAGRPSNYKPEYCQQLIEHMAKGLSFETFQGARSKQTLYDWVEKYPEFADAKKEAFRQCQLFWEKVGIKLSLNGGGNATTWIFNMKNRFGWRDKQEISTNQPININIVKDE